MDSPNERMAERLARELDTRGSVEIKVLTRIINKRKDETRPALFDTTEEHYIETGAGQRYCDYILRLGDRVVGRSSHFADGSRFADVDYSDKDTSLQQKIEYRKSYWKEEAGQRREAPGPIRFLHVGREPLTKALKKAEYLGKGRVLDRDCEVFLFARVPWTVPQDQVYSLDAATGIPLKVEAFRDRAAREKNQPLWTWTAASLEKVDGRHVTTKASQTAFGASGAPEMIWEQSVESVAFNRDYPAAMFRPTPGPGVIVMDTTKKTNTTAPGALKAPPTAKGETSSAPVQAVPPADWTSYASPAMLAVGVAILIGSGLLWWRRR